MPFDDTIFLKKKVDVLSFFTDEQLRHVTSVIERNSYKKGQTLVFQGEVTNNFFVIKKGRVSVSHRNPKDKEQAMSTELKAGDFFGEVSLLENLTSNATVKAAEDDTEVLVISHDSFQYLLKQNPQLETVLRERIAQRKAAQAPPAAPPAPGTGA